MSMELLIVPKGNKYTVQDKKQRTLYVIKKKAFGGGLYLLLDSSEYQLYSFAVTGDARKPTFDILHNGAIYMKVYCKSMFLDPTIIAENDSMSYSLVSKDRKEFEMYLGTEHIGHMKTLTTMQGELHYDMEIDDKAFDDYIPLFAVAADKAFGEMNKR
jgi:hypothetical protein